MAADPIRPGGFRRLPRGDGRLAGRSGGDPRRLPDQLRDAKTKSCARSRSPRSPMRCGSATGSAPPGSSFIPGAQKGEPLGPSMKRAAKVIAAALKDSEQLPAAARADGRPQRAPRPRLRPDRGADRAGRGRQAARPLPRLLPPLRPGLRHHRRRAPRRGPRRSGRQGRPRAPALPPRQRRRRAARLLPRPPRQHRQGRDGQIGPRRLPLRAPLRGPAGDAGDAGPEQERPRPQEVLAAKRLRKAGLKARRCREEQTPSLRGAGLRRMPRPPPTSERLDRASHASASD